MDILYEIRRPERIDLIEKLGGSYRNREHRADIHIDIIVPDEITEPRGHEVRVGASKAPEEIERKRHGETVTSARTREKGARAPLSPDPEAK